MIKVVSMNPGDPKSGESSSLSSELIAPNVVLTTMRGRITAELADNKRPQFRAAVSRTRRARWVIDQLELRGFEPLAVHAGGKWFEDFKEYLGAEVIFVSNIGSAKMVAAALAFSVHLPVTTFETVQKALRYLRVEERSAATR